MRALCPRCLTDTELTSIRDSENEVRLQCGNEHCRATDIPLLYLKDYTANPPCPCFFLARPGHGKATFINAFLEEVNRLCSDWPEFCYSWLDEDSMRQVHRRFRSFQNNPFSNNHISPFQGSLILRMHNIPNRGGSTLIMAESPGDTFSPIDRLTNDSQFFVNCPHVIWFVSLAEDEGRTEPHGLANLLIIYRQALMQLGSRVKQNLILVLTKGDLLVNREHFPESARRSLMEPSYDPAGPNWQMLESTSQDLESWLRMAQYHHIVNLAKQHFDKVRFCVVSAVQPSPTNDQLQFEMIPRGVLAPLFWLWRLQDEQRVPSGSQ